MVIRGIVVLCFVALLAGCTTPRGLVDAQRPGSASGAGASLLGPANSGEPSTQVAERTIEYHPPALPALALPAPQVPGVEVPAPAANGRPPALPSVASSGAPAPARVTERVQTTIGAHQDAAGILKAASQLLGPVRLTGLLVLLLGVGGLLHSAGNHESGYPACWMLCTVVGVLLLITNSWLLLLGSAAPAGLYFAQKFGLLRLPIG